MKKCYKRFLAFVLAIAMSLSFTIIATASNNSTRAMEEITRGQTFTGEDNKVTPLYEGRFTLTEEQYITMVFISDTPISVTLLGINGDASDIGMTKIFSPSANATQESMRYAGGKFPTGTYEYRIRPEVSSDTYVFILFRTDVAVDRG